MSTFDPSRCRVLIVEDEWLVREMMADVLEETGFTVSLAASAAEALRVLRRDPPIDLVVSDIEMPGVLDGVDLARLLRSQRPEIGVVMVSGCRPRTLPPGVLFLAKPFVPAELLRVLSDLAAPVRAAS
ncbi:response regulator [uncultured Methylovirgula sp.]|uniref:response regulator n=1 Tax=uncultured Methylovirgula sp. TaxID=1285960 RepID=UPI002603BFE5|nr:response regulator [uncultured Methylovirgula sp.]